MNQPSETPERPKSDDLPTIKMYQDIVDRAHTEVMHVREVYKWLIASLTIIISVGLALAVYLTYNNIHEMRADMKAERADIKADMNDDRAEMKAEVELMRIKAKQEYLQLEADLKSSVEKSVHDVEGKVKTRIDAEFDDKKIRSLVEATAQERIDKVADNIISQQIDKKITPKINVVDTRIKELSMISDYNSVLNAAKNDDRKAFEQLRLWSNDESYPLQPKAEIAFRAIVSDAKVLLLSLPTDDQWKPSTDPLKVSLPELRNEFRSLELAKDRNDLLWYLADRKDISKKERIGFFIEVLRTDQSLVVAQRAAELFNKLTGQRFDTTNPNLIFEWYEKHSLEIE